MADAPVANPAARPLRTVIRSRTSANVVALGLILLALLSLQGPIGVSRTAAATQPPARTVVLDAPFRVATFNLLGYGHTAPGGNRSGYADGVTRMNYTYRLLTRHGIDIVGFQEFQTEQFERFNELTAGTWGTYPGDTLTRAAMHNSIAWRNDTWELVEADSIPIPYFDGVEIRMPFVLLRNLETGRLVYFANFHNPANARGPAERWRNEATARQIELALTLRRSGLPVVFTGDFNEREDYFCQLTAGAPMKAANGGSTGTPCAPPAQMRIDWIFGSTNFRFLLYEEKEGRLVRRASDHPLIFSDLALRPVV